MKLSCVLTEDNNKQILSIISDKFSIILNEGDIILTGKFKNKKTVIKKLGINDKGQPIFNGKNLLTFRIVKLIPENET